MVSKVRCWLGNLSVDNQIHEVLPFLVAQTCPDKAEPYCCLFAPFFKVPLVESEPQFTVFENELITGVIVAAFFSHWIDAALVRI